tara:strand:- start:685 stop:1608 length:924 start_codon:yes stop_codon:yes gene_type:complete
MLDLEVLRKKWKSNHFFNKVLIIVSLITIVGLFIMGYIPFRGPAIGFSAAVFGLILFLGKRSEKEGEKIRSQISSEIFKTAFSLHESTLSYRKDGGISQQSFDDSKIAQFGYNIFKSHDQAIGNFQGLNVNISQIFARFRSKNSSHLVFKGLFMQSKLQNNINGYFIIRLKEKNQLMKLMRTNVSGFLSNFMGIDSPKEYDQPSHNEYFNANYKVYASHSFIAENILTPDFVDNYAEHTKFEFPISLSIINNQLNIGGHIDKPLLKLNLDESLKKISNIDEDIMYYIKMTRLIDYLNLKDLIHKIIE